MGILNPLPENMKLLPENFHEKIFRIKTQSDFEELAMHVFRFQAVNNPVYKNYLAALNCNPAGIAKTESIPHLPVGFFKTQLVTSFSGTPQVVFTSSGSTGAETSRHAVKDIRLYEESFLRCFELFYGKPSQYCLFALLPSYMEREGSSLVYMAKKLVEATGHPNSGFYLSNLGELAKLLTELEQKKQPILLLGVSFALLDLAEKHPQKLEHTIIMETGGMKGRRNELTREELHLRLGKAFGVGKIHSEYGMTELFSQAYSAGNGRYLAPPWMKISIRDIYDPFSHAGEEKTGGINITDLANIYSCSFIEASDLGKLYADGSFEVLGRIDNSDIRGCNLLVE